MSPSMRGEGGEDGSGNLSLFREERGGGLPRQTDVLSSERCDRRRRLQLKREEGESFGRHESKSGREKKREWEGRVEREGDPSRKRNDRVEWESSGHRMLLARASQSQPKEAAEETERNAREEDE